LSLLENYYISNRPINVPGIKLHCTRDGDYDISLSNDTLTDISWCLLRNLISEDCSLNGDAHVHPN